MTIDAAAGAADISKSALSRIENALVGVKVPVVRALVRAYGATEREEVLVQLARDAAQRGWWQEFTDILNDQLAVYASFELEARAIRAFEPFVIPGLFQTPAYAAALFRVLGTRRTPEEIERRVAFRSERQKRLADLNLWAIVDEAALRRYVGGAETMRGQLTHLAEIVEWPNVDFQVLTLRAGAHAGLAGAFTLFDFPDQSDPAVVYAETPVGTLWLDKADEVRRLSTNFDRLRAAALSPDESREYLVRIIEEIV